MCKKAEEKQPSDTLGFYELFSTPLKDLLPRFAPPFFNRCRQPDEMRRLSVLRRLAGTKLNVPGVSRAWNPEAAGRKKKRKTRLSGPRRREELHHQRRRQGFHAALSCTFTSGQSVTSVHSTSCDSPTHTPVGSFCHVSETNEAN